MSLESNNIKFITNNNIEMLWELIVDMIDKNVKTNGNISYYRQNFISKAKSFYEREKYTRQDIMEMNKMFMSENVEYFKNLYKEIENSNKKEYITIEELHDERLNLFEKSLENRKNEFNNLINPPIPKKPIFEENYSIEKINNEKMQNTINKMLIERNFESNNLLKKSEKENNEYEYVNQVKPKFIKIGEEVDLNIENGKKKISWGKNKEYSSNEIELNIEEKNNKQNIFSKLKKKENTIGAIYNDDLIIEIKEKMYNLEDKMNEIIELLKNKNEINKKQKYKDKDI